MTNTHLLQYSGYHGKAAVTELANTLLPVRIHSNSYIVCDTMKGVVNIRT